MKFVQVCTSVGKWMLCFSFFKTQPAAAEFFSCHNRDPLSLIGAIVLSQLFSQLVTRHLEFL